MKLILKTSYRDVELMETPGLAVVELTPRLAQRIYRFRNAVKQLGCYSITEFNYDLEFTEWAENDDGVEIPGKPLRVDVNELVVTDDMFHWTCMVRHTDVVLTTQSTFIDDIPYPDDEDL